MRTPPPEPDEGTGRVKGSVADGVGELGRRRDGGVGIVLKSLVVINSPGSELGAVKASNQPPVGLAPPPHPSRLLWLTQ